MAYVETVNGFKQKVLNTRKAREREMLLWLMHMAHGTVRDDLKEPYYPDGQGQKLIKPDYVLGLTSGELYAAALGNIYRTPNYRNYTHDEILQLLSKKGYQLVYSNGNPITETDLSFNRPIRMRAHLPVIDAISQLAKREMGVPNGVLKDSARTQTSPFKKTGFAPLPNSTSWLELSSPADKSRLSRAATNEELPENNFQPGQPQVINLKLALEEKQRKLRGQSAKKGHEWIQQVGQLGDNAFIKSGPNAPASSASSQSSQKSEEEHLYEEISENKDEDIGETSNFPYRRAKWTEQTDIGAGDAANVYSTRQPPKPLPRRNVSVSDHASPSSFPAFSMHNTSQSNASDFDSVDDASGSHTFSSVSEPLDEALQQFIPTGAAPKPVKFKPKVIRNPQLTNGTGTVTLGPAIGGGRGHVGGHRDFVNSIDVLNPTAAEPRKLWNDNANDDDGNASFNVIEENNGSEMERRKQKILESQIKRRAEQELARQAKEFENAEKAELQRQRQAESAKKKEEDRIRRQIVFEEYQRRKAAAAAEEAGLGPPVTMRENKSRKPRPLSVHANSVTTPVQAPPVTDFATSKIKRCPSQGDIMKVSQEFSILSLHNSRVAAASARHGPTVPERRQLSPPGGFRTRAVTTDSISDASSSNSNQDVQVYNGPKLFKKPSAKSNRLIIHNAIRDCCLPGIVNEDVQKKVLEALARYNGSHFLVLFRDANCQFRGLYAYDADVNEAVKVYGTGPTKIDDSMTEKLYKYNSGSKKFSIVPTTHHMSVQIDGITIQSALWYGKKTTGLKPPLEIF
ncbi:patronin-like isoform X2 [Paramacrobiotus metropolitanus]|uniref:patronin-like isoform X2 n=1 Tax=Paramacrobiotus metropolitanus TaxID=2943436 RepID=UPI002445DF81|nr:patronin-like isoform X2 [Paramacrobiotus metropolitanus]